jgi:hypothetical protein
VTFPEAAQKALKIDKLDTLWRREDCSSLEGKRIGFKASRTGRWGREDENDGAFG